MLVKAEMLQRNAAVHGREVLHYLLWIKRRFRKERTIFAMHVLHGCHAL